MSEKNIRRLFFPYALDMLFEVLQDFLSENVDKKFTTNYNVAQVAQCSGTHGRDESLTRGVAVSFTVKFEVPAQVHILLICTTFLFPLGTPLRQSR